MTKLDSRQLSIDTQNYLRGQTIRLREQGKPVGEIDEYLGINQSVVGKWWRQYKATGEAALIQQTRGRRPGSGQLLREAQQAELRQCIETGDPLDYGIEQGKRIFSTSRILEGSLIKYCS